MKFLTLLVFLFFCSSAVAGYGLSEADVKMVQKLGDIAITNSSAVLSAKLTLDTAKQAESIGGQILKNLNLNVSVSSGNTLPLDQINPSLSISAGLNVSNLVNQQPSQVPALEAKLREAEAAVRLEVLRKYSAWRLTRSRAQTAADTLDVRVADYKTMQAKVKAGTATQTDLLHAIDAMNAAVDTLETANHNIVIAKTELAFAVGVTFEELQKLLTDTK